MRALGAALEHPERGQQHRECAAQAVPGHVDLGVKTIESTTTRGIYTSI
jgi:hypothetical protein